MEINKVIANTLNAADVKLNNQEQTENNEVKTSDIEETKDEDATLKLEDESEEKSEETGKENKYNSKSTYMSDLLKLEDPNENNLGAKDFIISEINSAKNIGELKDLLMNLKTLDMDTQLGIMDLINSINFDDDLQTAKNLISNRLK